MKQLEAAPPLALARGEGPWLIDPDGRRYLDAISSWWVNLARKGLELAEVEKWLGPYLNYDPAMFEKANRTEESQNTAGVSCGCKS